MLANKIGSAFDRDEKLRVLFLFDPQENSKNELTNWSFDDIHFELFNGRTLDIFEKRSGYTIEDFVQEKRRCKDFNVTYIPKDIQ